MNRLPVSQEEREQDYACGYAKRTLEGNGQALSPSPQTHAQSASGGCHEQEYGSSTGYNGRWKTICKTAGIPYLSAHAAGRHGFYTELVVRQGVDPVTAAEAGRWSDVSLPLRVYAHSEADEAKIRALFRTKLVQQNDKVNGK